jgi:hypothetical protein
VNDDAEVYLKVINGGTVGVTGITYQISLDNGRTPGITTALGTATTVAVPGLGGVTLSFTAATLIAGDIVRFRANAPCWNATDLGLALAQLALNQTGWELCQIVGAIDAAALAAIVTAFGSMPEKAWIGHMRMPNTGESEAAYKTAMDAIFSGLSASYGMLCSAATKTTSGVNFRQYRRPFSFSAAARAASVLEHIDISKINLGPLPGVDIRDANGNVDEHDEAANPGLDDSRFCVARTWQDAQGVYVNNPRLFSPTGSDFQYLQHRRVMNIAKAALRTYFQRRLSEEINVDATTGFILEQDAGEIEAGANAILAAVLTSTPKASKATFTLSRTDNLLSTQTLTGQARIIPLAYPKFINLDIGFFNPALQIVQV